MSPRTQWTEPERHARSQLAKLVHDEALLVGSLVAMARTCGKPRCKCRRGDKHVSCYLSIRIAGQRKMVYVPPSLESLVRQAVQAHQQVQRLTEQVSQACLDRFLAAKAEGQEESAAGPTGAGRP